LVVVTTTTLATGVNVDGIEHVAIWTDPISINPLSTKQTFSSHELAQMIGRCGRWSLGLALLRGINPPTSNEIISSLPPLIHDSEANIFTWLILRMSCGYNLTRFDNKGRISLTTSEWIDMMCLMPTTISIEKRLTRESYEELVRKLTIITRLCDENEEGKITSTANSATLRICQNDSSMAILLCHIVEGYVKFWMKNVFHLARACPLLTSLVYWTSRHISLPTIYWNTSRFNYKSHAQLLIESSICPSTLTGDLSLLTTCLQEVLTHESTFGTPMASMSIYEKDKIISLSIATSYAVMGCPIHWYEYVPREDLGKILQELPIYAESIVHTLGLRWDQTHVINIHAQMAICIINTASEMINAYLENRRNGYTYAETSTNPLICYLARIQSRNPRSYTPKSTNDELRKIGFINTNWISVLTYGQDDLTGNHPYKISNAWIESIIGPSITVEGTIITLPDDYDSS
jgi:hypothetical protein